MVRLLPSFVTGIACNVLIALLVGRVPVVYLMGKWELLVAICCGGRGLNAHTGVGTLLTAFGSIFFSLVHDGQSYWSYGFPSAVIVVFGADFVFSSGTLFIAKCALPHEQSVAGALFTVMTQVCIDRVPPSSRFVSSPCRDGAQMTSLSDGSIGHELMSIDVVLGPFQQPVLVDPISSFGSVLFDSEELSTLIQAGRRTLTCFGQLGTAFGLAITTIVYNTVLERDSLSLGVDLDVSGSDAAPRAAQLHAYQDANWGAFAFGVMGELTYSFPSLGPALFCPLCCGGSLGSPIRPKQGKPEKVVIDYGMCYSKLGR